MIVLLTVFLYLGEAIIICSIVFPIVLFITNFRKNTCKQMSKKKINDRRIDAYIEKLDIKTIKAEDLNKMQQGYIADNDSEISESKMKPLYDREYEDIKKSLCKAALNGKKSYRCGKYIYKYNRDRLAKDGINVVEEGNTKATFQTIITWNNAMTIKNKILEEVNRFERIWTPECQKVNPSGFSMILAMFLATVDTDIVINVKDSIFKKYGG